LGGTVSSQSAPSPRATCKVIVRLGVGYDIIDVAACQRRGILVCTNLQLRRSAIEEIVRVLTGQAPRNPVH
jgi:lactate dehydrogenase-like 2-hydroxyacid dehydrogenase